ncbi:MAG: 50S ribosomal protein L17 [Deltaproteobacteria bacterium]|nr:50S ribosomal protein L17 [Deltaproteobacteria bacterium]
MRHLNKGNKLSRETSHRKAMLLNLCKSLIEHGRITTTVAKAKELRGWIEPMVTMAKEDSIHRRRLAFAKLRDNGLVARLFGELGPKYVARPGGYTRTLKLGRRTGDAAEMALIEFV